MTNLVNSLAEFDILRGKTPIDPTRIEGFGPDAPPPPAPTPEPVIPSAREVYGEPVDIPEIHHDDDEIPSPLIQAGLALRNLPVPEPPRMTASLIEYELGVHDQEAIYKGRRVSLEPADVAAVVRVVLRALRRDLDRQYKLVAEGKRMRQPSAPKKPRKAKREEG